MKNQSLFLLAALAFAATACMENGLLDDGMYAKGSSLFNTSSYDASTEALMSANFEDIDQTTDEAFDRYFAQAGRFSAGNLDCAEVTKDSVNKVITIDFGDGCENKKGTVKSGKIIITYSGERGVPGATKVVTFEDFFIDSVQVEGVRTVMNVSDNSVEGLRVFETSMVGGKHTFSDGTTITREANHTRTRYRSENTEESYASLTGNASGTLQDGTAYTMDIISEILITGACDIKVPVSGVKEFVAGDNMVTVDFGDGTCDNLAEVTTNGETETIELKSRGLGKHKGNRGRGNRG